MKKVIPFLFCIIFIISLAPFAVSADTGPKPSVVIEFKGLENEIYFVTLLSKYSSNGPFSAATDDPASRRHKEGDINYNIYLKFLEYEDSDGYYFLQYFFQDCSDMDRYNWTYYPPEEFKILIYFPEYDTFAVSDRSYEKYAFDSYFTVDVSDVSVASLHENGFHAYRNYNYSRETVSLIARIVITIILEINIALLFGYREKKQIIFIGAVNIITQTILNLLLNIFHHSWMFILCYILFELIVFIIEAAAYLLFLKKVSIKPTRNGKAILYAFIANAVSFAAGFLLAYIIPEIF